MKAYILFGISLLTSVLYISIYTLISPLTDLFFSLSLLFLLAFFYTKIDSKKNLYIKLGFLGLMVSIMVLPTLFLSPEKGLFRKALFILIIIGLSENEYRKVIQTIREKNVK